MKKDLREKYVFHKACGTVHSTSSGTDSGADPSAGSETVENGGSETGGNGGGNSSGGSGIIPTPTDPEDDQPD